MYYSALSVYRGYKYELNEFEAANKQNIFYPANVCIHVIKHIQAISGSLIMKGFNRFLYRTMYQEDIAGMFILQSELIYNHTRAPVHKLGI